MVHAVVPRHRATGLPGLDPAAWPDVMVVEATGSTNADLVARARAGARGPAVLVARSQYAGRGRLGRSWQSPPGSSLALSALLTPGVPGACWGWLPLLTGLAVRDALAGLGASAALKWPNDVLVPGPARTAGGESAAAARYGGRKVAGILVEGVPETGIRAGAGSGAANGGPRQGSGFAPGGEGGVVVVGVGLNVAQGTDELPVDHATSLRLALAPAAPPTPDEVAAAVLDALAGRLADWRRADGDADACGLAADYRAACLTLGRRVTVGHRAGQQDERPLHGEAVDVTSTGALVLRTAAPTGGATSTVPAGPAAERLVTVVAGDVEHVR